MTFTPADVIEVSAWGRVVGAVVADPDRPAYVFEYDPAWVATGQDLAPLMMPRRSGLFEFLDLSPQTFHGLPGMLADALPDRFGNALVNAWMADQGIDAARITALDRLAYASNRAMGALTFAPPVGPDATKVSLVQVADLVTAARAEYRGTVDRTATHQDETHEALRQLITVGSTAGGARAKAVIAYNPVTGQMRSGQLGAPEGYEQWLLKLDGVGEPTGSTGDPLVSAAQYCRVEYAYYLMATRAGISMSPSQLLFEGPRAHFMTKRFDRGPDDARIHSQTLCALAHLDYNLGRTNSYGSYFLTAGALDLGPDDFEQMFRRVAFNVFGVNRDDHTKNFSFVLPEGGKWAMAPAYDVTHSYWHSEWTQAHQMSVNGKFADIGLDDLHQLGDRHSVPNINGVIRDVAAAVDTWPEVASEAGVDAPTTERVAGDLAEFRPR